MAKKNAVNKAQTAEKNDAPEQEFLFGEADMILNTLETELKEWQSRHSKILDAIDRCVIKKDEAVERIVQLSDAVAATRKHAPMKEDPAPPTKEEEKRDEEFDRRDEEFDKEHGEAIKEAMKEEHIDEAAEKIKKDREEKIEAPAKNTEVGDPGPAAAEDELAPPEDPNAPQEEEAEAEDTVKKGVGLFREAAGPTVPELVKQGDIINTSWGKDPYRVEEVEGPFNRASIPLSKGEDPEDIETPDYYTLKCSAIDAPRTKAGKLKKTELIIISFLIAVTRNLVSIFTDSDQSISLALPKGDAPNSFRKVTPTDRKEYF